jgi:hypothetical protein
MIKQFSILHRLTERVMTLAALISLYAVHSMAESTLCITNAYDNIELRLEADVAAKN